LKAENMKVVVIDALENLKGRDIKCMNVSGITTIADYMVVVTGTSSRHVKSLAEEVAKQIKDAGGSVLGKEGDQGQVEWVLLDLGDVIVHVMLEETRKLYDLESLWNMSPPTNN